MAQQSLESFVEEVNGQTHLRVEHDYGDGFVRLRTSEAERRQAAQDIRCSENIVLEMLRNSRDAHASNIYVATAREGAKRTLVIIDDGDGVPEAMHELVFEPRVTSKLDTSHMDAWGMHGRGMALYSIAQNSVSAAIEDSAPGLGCSIRVVTDCGKLPEKKNQSSFPTFTIGEDGTVAIRGPRNILRTSCEFAIEARSSCSVFIGSPVEIAASIFYYGSSSLSAVERLFCHNPSELPVTKRLATATDPDSLAQVAGSLGLDISPRSARRIMDGQIVSVEPLLDQIAIEGSQGTSRSQRRRSASSGARGVRLDRGDASSLSAAVKKAYGDIAEKYYLEPDVQPTVRSSADRIVVSIPVVRKD